MACVACDHEAKHVTGHGCLESVVRQVDGKDARQDCGCQHGVTPLHIGRVPAPDLVNHPPHYTNHPSGVECITITEHMNFNLGNATKYIWRADLKNGIEDLEKAAWYVAREIARRTRQA